MAPIPPLTLKIRNHTTTPLELQKVERFAAEAVSRGAGTLTNVKGVVTGLINATEFPTTELKPKGDPREVHAVSHHLAPFSVHDTGLPAPAPRREILRLTFGDGAGLGHAYRADAPGPLRHSQTMARLGDAPESFTTVYVAQRGLLAIFSSTKLATWMAELHDALPLSVLSIPGTHNSPTYRVALPSVRCQAVSVREQLDNGVRFLDVRVSAGRDDDNMTLVHSAFPVSLTGARYLANLLAECYAFLDAHPREALLVSVKREGTGRASDQQMARHLHARFIDRDPARWIVADRIPTLGEARGKIILVRRFAVDEDVRRAAGGDFGIDGQSWPDNCEDGAVSSGLVRVQDFYGVGLGTTIEKKISYSCAQLERAASMAHGHEHEQNGTANGAAENGAAEAAAEAAAVAAAAAVPPLFVNFLTASNFFNATCWPERIAAKVNPRIVEYLCARHAIDGAGERGLSVGHGGTGIVVTDWVGAHGDWDLIRCVVGMNARLIGKK